MSSNAHDTLYSYWRGLESGAFDRDLSPDDRRQVAYLVGCAVRILADFGGTDRDTLRRMVRDPQAPDHINARVSDIIFGCMTPGWTRTGLA